MILPDRFRYRHTFIWNRFFYCQKWVTVAHDDFVEWQLQVSSAVAPIIHNSPPCFVWIVGQRGSASFALACWESSVCLPDSRDSKFASHFTVQTRSLVLSRIFFFFPPSERNALAFVRWSRNCRLAQPWSGLHAAERKSMSPAEVAVVCWSDTIHY